MLVAMAVAGAEEETSVEVIEAVGVDVAEETERIVGIEQTEETEIQMTGRRDARMIVLLASRETRRMIAGVEEVDVAETVEVVMIEGQKLTVTVSVMGE